MHTRGQHLLVEYWGCDGGVLNDVEAVEQVMRQAAEASGATIVDTMFHRFAPQGLSGVVVVEESHLSIHTWPETGYAAVDFYTCGDCRPQRAHRVLKDKLRPTRAEQMFVQRGVGPSMPSMVLDLHVSDHDEASHESSVGEEAADADPFRPGRPAAASAGTGIGAPAEA